MFENVSGDVRFERDLYTTSLSEKRIVKNRDKFRGCLVGGAAGDALGYAVEFLSVQEIERKYGAGGIREYNLTDGAARVSDDTQMTLFTANALLFGTTRGSMRGIMGSYESYVAEFYKEWLETQQVPYGSVTDSRFSWLMRIPEMYAVRAPGNTCMSAIMEGCRGTVRDPVNNSKGCGGIMRVAPVGLYFGSYPWAPAAIDHKGADIAALTHGHEMGYIPAAMLVHIIRLVAHNDEITLKEAVLDAVSAMGKIFFGARHLPLFIKLIERAVWLSGERDTDDIRAIRSLGEGWCGDEALAIAVYCALKYSNDFDQAICAAVNHSGDSDSTGAITGNILGAYLGLSGIPKKYTDDLELYDVILEIADDLYTDCPINGYSDLSIPENKRWFEKYVDPFGVNK